MLVFSTLVFQRVHTKISLETEDREKIMFKIVLDL